MIEALRTDFSVRQICQTLGFTQSNLYYQPKNDPYEEVLQKKIKQLSLRYPTYRYRRITQLLVRSGYTTVALQISAKTGCFKTSYKLM